MNNEEVTANNLLMFVEEQAAGVPLTNQSAHDIHTAKAKYGFSTYTMDSGYTGSNIDM